MSDTAKIRNTLDSIAKCLDSLKRSIDFISENIKTESIVNPDVISSTMKTLLELKNSQDTLKKDYPEIFPGEKCSDSLNEVISNVESYEAQLEEKKLLSKAKYIIIKFKSIRSKVEECQKYLDEYSEQLKELNDKDLTLDEYTKAVEPYEEFYRIVDDSSRDDKLEYSRKESIFSDSKKLLLLLLQDNLYIDKSLMTDLDEFIAANSGEPLQLSFESMSDTDDSNEEKVPVSEQLDSADNITEQSSDETSAAHCSDSAMNTETDIDDNATQPMEATVEDQSASSAGDASDDESERLKIEKFNSFNITVKPREGYSTNVEDKDDGKKTPQKTFKKDIEKYGKGNGFILYAFTKFHYVTESILKKGHKYANVDLDYKLMLDSLFKLGYIRKDTIEGFEPVYCLTSKAINCLKEKTNADWFKRFTTAAKNPWDLEHANVIPLDEENSSNIILTRIGYLVIRNFYLDFFSKGIVIGTDYLTDDYFSAFYIYGKHKTSFYYLSCFLSEEENITSLMNTLDFQIKRYDENEVEFSLLVSDNLDECTSLMNFLKSLNGIFASTRFYGYSVNEKKIL
ncbi:hypothetical protein [Ruminococcus sp. HUN007]|uniref:hypothetical protein n=1 Tax=Ruminococcus sp. HUN007 TaxID=1514668 RepID=UPI0005D2CCFA|nr:hypothetical protein [Ruminococcus sp. HUN007]